MLEESLSPPLSRYRRGDRVGMDKRVRVFIQDMGQTLVGLDVALFYQANPRTFDSAAGIALRTHRSVEAVEPALARLAECGILETFSRGDGRFQCYALSTDLDVWRLLCLVSEAYHDDPQSRKEIVRLLMAKRLQEKGGGAAGSEEESASNE